MHIRQSQGIKDIIIDYPEVAEILQEYGIECATCTVGICQLGDILEMHSLPKEQARTLMERVESVFSGDANNFGTTIQDTPERHSPPPGTLSAAIATLMREHTFIKRFISTAPYLTLNLNLTDTSDQVFAYKCLEFITYYADRLHHGKEEGILFRYFDTSKDIFQVMLEDHAKGRSLVELMWKAIMNQDPDEFTTHFLGYRDLLNEHIKKEDSILFPWIDLRLNDIQKKKIQNQFELSDEESDLNSKMFEDFVLQLESEMPCTEVSRR